jgi:hypothetical protein
MRVSVFCPFVVLARFLHFAAERQKQLLPTAKTIESGIQHFWSF